MHNSFFGQKMFLVFWFNWTRAHKFYLQFFFYRIWSIAQPAYISIFIRLSCHQTPKDIWPLYVIWSSRIGLSREGVRQIGLVAQEKLKNAAKKTRLEAMLVKHWFWYNFYSLVKLREIIYYTNMNSRIFLIRVEHTV